MSFLVTDTGFFGYLSSNSSYSQKGPKTTKNAAKMDRRKIIFEDTFLKTPKHAQQSEPDFLREYMWN